MISNHVTFFDPVLILYALPARLRRRLAVSMDGERLESMRRPIAAEWIRQQAAQPDAVLRGSHSVQCLSPAATSRFPQEFCVRRRFNRPRMERPHISRRRAHARRPHRSVSRRNRPPRQRAWRAGGSGSTGRLVCAEASRQEARASGPNKNLARPTHPIDNTRPAEEIASDLQQQVAALAENAGK